MSTSSERLEADMALEKKSELTLTVLGCGTMGIAVLSGILASLNEPSESSEPSKGPIPTKFIACVRRTSSAERVHKALDKYNQDVTVVENDNINALEKADVVLLGCKPFMLKEVLEAPGIRKALSGKLVISILAGVPALQVEETLYGKPQKLEAGEAKCRVVRAMPSTAAVVRESMTTIETPTPALPESVSTLINWMFSRCGKVVHLPPAIMDVSTSLGGSGPAFCALMLEALADGGVAMGMPRAEAQLMAAQVMKGTAAMVLEGEHPALIREKVSTPGGCTIGGLLVLEEGRVRGSVARAVREATVVASQLGQGVKGVNGTRW